MEYILILFVLIVITPCLWALEIIRQGDKPRNGEKEKLRELDEQIKKHNIRKS